MAWSATPNVDPKRSGWTATPTPDVSSVPGWSGSSVMNRSAPAMAASASMPTPKARLEIMAAMLAATAAIPSPTVRLETKPAPLAASAVMPTPTVKLEIIAPPLAATAVMPTPGVRTYSDIIVDAAVMDADAAMPNPTARLWVPPTPLQAAAVMPSPTVALKLTAAVMAAAASMPSPAARLEIPDAPALAATAVMPAPQIQLQPAFGVTGSEFISTSTKTTSGSLTIAVTAGDVVLIYLSGETSSSESPITVSGETVTARAVQPFNNSTSNASLRCYSFVASTTATKTISYNGSFPNDVEIQAVSYPGVANIGATTTAFGASGATSASVNPSPATLERVVVAFASDQSSNQWTPSGGTNRWNHQSTTSGSNYITPLAISDGNAGTYSVASANVGNWASIATILSGV